jgi:hypothetical protein
MRISVKRTGGFAGLTTRWAVDVGGEELEQGWREAIEACPWEAPPARQDEPDRYVYDIRAGERRATLPEQQLTGAWLSLVDMTRRAAGRRSG